MRRWLLPESPDLLGLLAHQGEVTIRGLVAFCAWSAGDPSQGATLHEIEHEGDLASRSVTM